MDIQQFILSNSDTSKELINVYRDLISINIPTKLKKFPYNILDMELQPTYKEISLKYIKNKNYFEKKGGVENNIEIYYY